MATNPLPEPPETAGSYSSELESLIKQVELNSETKRKDVALKGASATLLIALAGTVASTISVFFTDLSLRPPRNIPLDPIEMKKAESRYEDRLQAIELSVKKLSSIKGAGQSIGNVQVSSDLSVLNTRVNNLSAAIMSSPEKALALPLLRRDVDAITKRIDEVQAQSKADMDRLYEQQKWMLGGIGTVLIAVAGGAITIILRSLPNTNKNSS